MATLKPLTASMNCFTDTIISHIVLMNSFFFGTIKTGKNDTTLCHDALLNCYTATNLSHDVIEMAKVMPLISEGI